MRRGEECARVRGGCAGGEAGVGAASGGTARDGGYRAVVSDSRGAGEEGPDRGARGGGGEFAGEQGATAGGGRERGGGGPGRPSCTHASRGDERNDSDGCRGDGQSIDHEDRDTDCENDAFTGDTCNEDGDFDDAGTRPNDSEDEDGDSDIPDNAATGATANEKYGADDNEKKTRSRRRRCH